MIVTFVSECEKKAVNKTCRVLDAFANRLGSRTWQTVITNEGLQSVKKLLRATASKNTAVSCHWIRSRSRSELVWIVGNRKKFNNEGIVPVNSTQKDIMNKRWENDWKYLPLIKSLAALAALFHDFGKASDYFQEKLKKGLMTGDPLRHEWVSILLLKVLVNDDKDEVWLNRLFDGNFEADTLIKSVNEKYRTGQLKKPLSKLPDAACMIAWIILSHHRLPADKRYKYEGVEMQDFGGVFDLITQLWGYENNEVESRFEQDTEKCLSFSNGLPNDSVIWLRNIKKHALKLIDCLPMLKQSLTDGSCRLVLQYTRLSLMMGDHWHSSQDRDEQWPQESCLYANTDKKTRSLKQRLDEHLVGVTKQALRIAHLLPAFENRNDELLRAYDVKALRRKNPKKYSWQDNAVSRIRKWRQEQEKRLPADQFGFFAVNMASTGTGKTFANAKIMRSLSLDGESLRYVLALGLRTLTLQTGDEYRERIKLDNDELAVLIGSRAVMDLHSSNRVMNSEENLCKYGSESEESLLDNEINFDAVIPESNLTTILDTDKNRQFLYAPVLCCTIDHLMSATETKRGGKYMLPFLRLMSSDLVIDEIDDFDGTDLIAVGRLIHLAGMLGRKVMLSSATIPPDLAEGYYCAYQAGWAMFAQMRERSPLTACAWIDENKTVIQKMTTINENRGAEEYRRYHKIFVDKRCTYLQKQTPKRKAEVIPCNVQESMAEEESLRQYFYTTIKDAVIEKHQYHHRVDSRTGKRVSFGVVRVANIQPCISLTRYLLTADFPDGIEIRTMAYHSRQVLLMRSEQEKHLDAVLKCSKGDQTAFSNVHIERHLQNIDAKDVIFILVASPVEEVGRDHDFDWAVVEPSSYRSFIQLGGRVLRHREVPENDLKSSNVALLQYNLKGFSQKNEPVFARPGYESRTNRLLTHDLIELVNVEKLSERLDAQPRISKNEVLSPQKNLADLEHECIHQLLTDYTKKGPESMEGWLSGCWWLTAAPQLNVRFRESSPELTLYLVPDGTAYKFAEKDSDGKPVIREVLYNIKRKELTGQELERLWLYRDYEKLLQNTGVKPEVRAALIYGEIGIPTYGKDSNDLKFIYISQLGLVNG